MLWLIISMFSIVTSILIYYVNSLSWWWLIILFAICFILWLIAYMVLAGIIASITIKRNKKIVIQNKLFVYVTRMTCRFLFSIYNMKIVVEGKEKIKDIDPCLVICNHQSNLDPIIFLGVYNEFPYLTFIMKESVMKIPIIGKWLFAGGFPPIDRNNDRKALITIVDSINKVKNGACIGVYPEGTRSKGKNVNEFKDGTFKIALKAKCPIVIAIIDNAYKVKKRFPFKRTKVLIKICEVLEYNDFEKLKSNEISHMSKHIVEENLKESREKYEWLN